MESIYAHNVPEAYIEGLWKLRIYSSSEDTRNGPVFTVPQSVHITISNPRQRVLFDDIRDANPFFHLMEVAWMFAGRNDLAFILPFNKKFAGYADAGSDILHAAYGHRWRNHFGRDQILGVTEMLRRDPTTRRAVIAMWDPAVDLEPHNDLPCNTECLFRLVEGQLDMTVVNRSNDFVWGMMGANAVHMTYLHELIAAGAELPLGQYHVFTTNMHMYKNMPNFEAIWEGPQVVDVGTYANSPPTPLLGMNETVDDIMHDCEIICDGFHGPFRTEFGLKLLYPVREGYLNKEKRQQYIDQIGPTDWREACQRFTNRRKERK